MFVTAEESSRTRDVSTIEFTECVRETNQKLESHSNLGLPLENGAKPIIPSRAISGSRAVVPLESYFNGSSFEDIFLTHVKVHHLHAIFIPGEYEIRTDCMGFIPVFR